MLGNELFQWMDTLSADEQSAFSCYLDGEEHRRKKLPQRLYAWLLAHPADWRNMEGWDSKRKLQEELHQVLFQNKEFKPQRIRRVFMDLKQILEDFIALKAAPRLSLRLDQEIKLLKYLLERGASELFQRRLTAVEAYLEAEAPLAPDTYIAHIWVTQMRTEFCIHHNIPNDGFERTNALAAQYYVVRTLENFTAMRVREQYHAKKHDYLFEPEIHTMTEALSLEPDGLIALWKSVHQLVALDALPVHYAETHALLEQLKHRLPLLTTRQIRGHMFNFMVKIQDLGNQNYYLRLWELLCTMLDEGTLHMPDGRMTFPFFNASVRAACLCSHQSWAANFLAKYAGDLVGAGKEEQIRYCQLLVDFHGGRLLETWHALLTFSPLDLRLETLARTMQVQIAYDLGKEDEFQRLIDSLSKFVSRNDALGGRFVSLVHEFARFAGRLGHARFISRNLPKGLATRLRAKDCAEKIWLLEKARELAHIQ